MLFVLIAEEKNEEIPTGFVGTVGIELVLSILQ